MRGFWLSIVLSVASIAPAAHAAEYRLGVQDRVRVEVYEYPNIAGEYELGAAGTVALPLVGEIPAEGLTPAELASRINARLAAEPRHRRELGDGGGRGLPADLHPR